jgi:phosphoribosylanthranilate isomerase
MTRVKICGITNDADARAAIENGASALGFVFWAQSPRVVSPDLAASIVAGLPPFVSAVGVFVDQPPSEVGAIARTVGLTAVQLHGREDAAAYAGLAPRIIKSIAVRGDEAIDEAARLPLGAMVLLDAYDPVARGGTGRPIDWTIAAAIARRRATVLSGGLHAANVADAIRAVRPAAVDVSSGVEASPGRKDPAKLDAFFSAVRSV